MPYIGQNLQVAYPTYKNIDDISGSFNGSTTSFALLVSGAAPVPLPLNSQQCLISVGGVIQRPDDTGSEGFRLSGGNIVFSSAPSTGEDFFGIILAGADYVNVGANFPDGSVGVPSITFEQDSDTGFYRSGSGVVSFSSNSVQTAILGSNSLTAPSFIPTSSTVPTNGVYLPAANSVGISTNSTERLRINSSGNVGIGTSSPGYKLDVVGESNLNGLRIGLNGDTINSTTAGASSVIAFQINGNEKIRLDSSGRLGIGTQSPDRLLTLSSATNTIARLTASTPGKSFDLGADTTGGYIQTTSADPIVVYTNNQERARWDSSGRYLVGTSSFSGEGTIVTRGSSAAAAGQSILVLQRGQTNPAPDLDLGLIRFTDAAGSLGAQIAAQCDGGFSWGTNDYPTRLVFSTTADGASSPTERARISSNGTANFYSQDDVIYARSNRAAGGIYATFVGVRDATSTTNGTISFLVYTNGNVQNTNGSYTTISDAKLKENITDASSQWDDLKAIQIRNWNFKAETGHETHRQIGPIAQELETVCPGLVFETPDRDADGNETGEVTKGVNQSVLYMKAVKALQEAMERIEQLEAEMAEVKAQLS